MDLTDELLESYFAYDNIVVENETMVEGEVMEKTPEVRRSSRERRPPKRLIEEC